MGITFSSGFSCNYGWQGGLLKIEIGPNMAGGDYDLVFYVEFRDEESLKAFREHPLHVAHRERCKDIVTGRLCGDVKDY